MNIVYIIDSYSVHYQLKCSFTVNLLAIILETNLECPIIGKLKMRASNSVCAMTPNMSV